jgi:hypothetical protein
MPNEDCSTAPQVGGLTDRGTQAAAMSFFWRGQKRKRPFHVASDNVGRGFITTSEVWAFMAGIRRQRACPIVSSLETMRGNRSRSPNGRRNRYA